VAQVRADAIGSIDVESGRTRSEGRGAVGLEAGLRDTVLEQEAAVVVERLDRLRRGPLQRAIVIAARGAAILANQTLTPPVVALATDVPREADGLEVVAVLLRGRLRGLDELVPGRRRLDAGLFHQVVVAEEREGADRDRQGVILALDLGRLHHREEVLLDLVVREDVLRERDEELLLHICRNPTEEDVEDVRSLAGLDRRGNLLPEV